ncbi:MAG: MMPL family transporter [Candidatus Aminicenantes bacterium]|nr:MMPL family transporter [Candidatus Aminicenantes bacterium]
MRDRILKNMALWHVRYPGRMLFIVILLTLVFGFLASQLKQTMRWSDLLPEKDSRTKQFNRIIDEFVTATNIIVVVQGPEGQIKRFADELAPLMINARDDSKNAGYEKKIKQIDFKIQKLESTNRADEAEALRLEKRLLQEEINRPVVRRVDYKTEIDFIRTNGFLLIKENDLKNMLDIYTDPNVPGLIKNINNSLEKEYVGRSESISTREKEDGAYLFLDGIENILDLMDRLIKNERLEAQDLINASDKLLYGEPYLLSYDKSVLIMIGVPNFSMMDLDRVISGTKIVQGHVDDLLNKFPDVKAGLTGFIPIGHDEMVYSEQSLGYTSLIAVIAILFLLVLSFRMWSAPLLALVSLLIGIIWAVGTATLVVGQLNIMTSMMAVILLGLGIDFSIHIISGFSERRAAGESIHLSLETTFLKNGKGIITGGMTTAAAFIALSISSSRGMKEMGLVTGFGLLSILLATFLVLPVLLIRREKRMDNKYLKSGKIAVKRDMTFRVLGTLCDWLGRRSIFTLALSILLTVFFVWMSTKISFDQNYMNIEPKGIPSVTLQDTIQEKYDLSMDYALVISDSIEESRELANSYKDLGSVASVEDISLYLPSPEQQKKRLPYLRAIKSSMTETELRPSLNDDDIPLLLQELKRLEMNIMEMQDMAFLGGQDKVDTKCRFIVGDPEDAPETAVNKIHDLVRRIENLDSSATAGRLLPFQQDFASAFRSSVLHMSSVESISEEDLPDSIWERYANRNRDSFLVTVIPAGNCWTNAEFLDRFVSDLESRSEKSTGMPPIFHALIEVIGRDGRNAALLTIFIVFLLLWFDFRNPFYALIAMIPLAVGVFWMVGFMKLAGMQFTVMNVMALPLIIGIGIDDGVHIVHRWIAEGRGNLRIVFSSTGKAILLTSLTTMLAFGSLIFSVYRGFGQLGGALFLGVGACFLTTVLFLTGILGAVEKKRIK